MEKFKRTLQSSELSYPFPREAVNDPSHLHSHDSLFCSETSLWPGSPAFGGIARKKHRPSYFGLQIFDFGFFGLSFSIRNRHSAIWRRAARVPGRAPLHRNRQGLGARTVCPRAARKADSKGRRGDSRIAPTNRIATRGIIYHSVIGGYIPPPAQPGLPSPRRYVGGSRSRSRGGTRGARRVRDGRGP